MVAVRSFVLSVLALTATASALQPALNDDLSTNEIYGRRTLASDSLLSDIMAECFQGINMEAMTCVRVRVLMYLDQLLGTGTGRQPHFRLSEHVQLVDTPSPVPDAVPRDTEQDQAAATPDEKLDEMIASRVGRFMSTHALRMQLPQTVFQSAVLTLQPSTLDLDVQFPPEKPSKSRALSEARGILKKKLLLPILLLLKLKMKALMPILVLMSSIKALKALVISKIALAVVVSFVFLQLFKKLGGGGAMMPMMPMMPGMEMTPAPASTYGVPAAPMPYSPPAPAPPTNSYGPSETSWEPAAAASSNSYSRVWDSHQLAYKGYYTPESTSQTQAQQQQQQSSSSSQ